MISAVPHEGHGEDPIGVDQLALGDLEPEPGEPSALDAHHEAVLIRMTREEVEGQRDPQRQLSLDTVAEGVGIVPHVEQLRLGYRIARRGRQRRHEFPRRKQAAGFLCLEESGDGERHESGEDEAFHGLILHPLRGRGTT